MVTAKQASGTLAAGVLDGVRLPLLTNVALLFPSPLPIDGVGQEEEEDEEEEEEEFAPNTEDIKRRSIAISHSPD